MSPTRTFSITPRGRFSLAQANAFGFGHVFGQSTAGMELAFAVDGDYEPAGVELSQSADGVVHATVHGDAPLDAVRAQTARILSLDHDGREWERVLEHEPPLAAFDAQLTGLRPVLFHSPYEAAAWSTISARIHRAQAAKLRADLTAALGTPFTLHGQTMHAFPSPARLIDGLSEWDGLNETKRARLLGVARAADDGLLDAATLQSLGPESTTARVLTLNGIGPFYASLVTIRGTGFTDLAVAEPRARGAALQAYGMPADASDADWLSLMDRWKPFRIWATVLCRVAAERKIAGRLAA